MNFIKHCEDIAKEHFAIDALRPAQREVLNLIDVNLYVLATLPTGSGKTLLYAIPSLIYQQGIVLVISPLISLMRDQARRMNQANIPCIIFNSEQNEIEKKNAWTMLNNRQVKIVFVSPERFVLPSFINLITKFKINMAVIDEAHCVVSWGHHFRPEYAEIGKYLSKINPVRILAITATASKHSRVDISEKVFPPEVMVHEFISNPLPSHLLVSSIRLFSQVQQCEKLLHILLNTSSQKTIVYFPTRKLCDEFVARFRKISINSVLYHAGLTKEEKELAEKNIHSAKTKTVVCATTAFGMGVDISGISLVVIYGFPSNIEEFFQMLGRAGRAGEKSEGILLWTGSDPIRRKYQFQSSFPSANKLTEAAKKITSLLPKNIGESTLVTKVEFIHRLNSINTFILKNDYTGIISGLRICGILEELNLDAHYYQIKFASDISLDQLLFQLPNTITKRQKILASIKNLISQACGALTGCQLVFPKNILIDSAELSEASLDEVLSYYQEKKLLYFTKINLVRHEPYILLKNNFVFFQKSIIKYINARNNFFSSLKELEKLSTATKCRLADSFNFFASHKQVAKKNICLQCDLCKKSGYES